MASLYKKVISGKPYWYLREMGWVDGKPKMVSERYVGTAADIEALLDAREAADAARADPAPGLRGVAAAWGLLADLGVAAVIDEEAGARPPGLPLSPGTYLALAALNRVVDPVLQARVRGLVAHHGGGPVHQDPGLGAGSPPVLGRDARGAAGGSWRGSRRSWRWRRAPGSGWTLSSVALDMTNFATFIDTGNGRAPIAQRGKAKQKRADLRLVGLGLVVTRDGGVPLLSTPTPATGPTSPSSRR